MLDKAAELSDAQVLRPGIQVVALLFVQRLQPQLLIARRGIHLLAENACYGGSVLLYLPAVSKAGECAKLEYVPVLLVKGDLLLDFLFLNRQQMLQIQFITQTAKESYIAPGYQRSISQSLAMRRGADVAAPSELGIQIR